MPSMKEVAARQALVGEYLAAFKLANPKKAPPELHYEDGWFHLKYGLSVEKHRKTHLEGMRDRLLARAAAESK